MEKITKREFLNVALNAINDSDIEQKADFAAFAVKELAKLDEANEKRREKISAKREENVQLANEIYEKILTDKPQTATQIGEILEMTPQKVTAVMKILVEEGKAQKTDLKIKGRPVKGYSK